MPRHFRELQPNALLPRIDFAPALARKELSRSLSGRLIHAWPQDQPVLHLPARVSRTSFPLKHTERDVLAEPFNNNKNPWRGQRFAGIRDFRLLFDSSGPDFDSEGPVRPLVSALLWSPNLSATGQRAQKYFPRSPVSQSPGQPAVMPFRISARSAPNPTPPRAPSTCRHHRRGPPAASN
jgi:hypothetical protein